MPLECQAKNTS